MKNIPFSPPDVGEEEIQAISEVLRSGWITTGPRTKLFEQAIADHCRVDHAVCLNSATAGLEMTLRVLGIGPGDEVITSAYTYTASASVIVHVGATPVLVDIAGDDGPEMDYEALGRAVTPRTKAVIPVDLAGIPCDYDRIFDVVCSASRRFAPSSPLQEQIGRIAVVTDAAHAFGAVWHGRPVGSVADITVFSFHAVKNLTTAEGGAVTWNPDLHLDGGDLYRKYQLLSLHGQSKDALAKSRLGAWEYDIALPAYKCNMTDIMAAIGLVQFRRYPAMLARRRAIINRYDVFCEANGIRHLRHYGDSWSGSGHLYITRFPDRDRAWCNALIDALARRGISTNVHYKPLPMHTAYRDLGFDIADYPNSLAYYQNEITLPLHTRLTDDDVDFVCDGVAEALKELA